MVRLSNQERLVEALRPFARLYEELSNAQRERLEMPVSVVNGYVLRVHHLRDAWMAVVPTGLWTPNRERIDRDELDE